MYSTKAKQMYIELYEKAAEKLASAYPAPPEKLTEAQKEVQSYETTTKR